MRTILISLILLASCEKAIQGKPALPEPQKVTIYTVQPQNVPKDFLYTGVVESSHQVQILPAVQGQLEKIAFKEGVFVHEGDLLFKIDDRVFVNRLKEAEADLEEVQATLVSAQKSATRLTTLYKEEAVSQKDLDDATSQLLTSQANLSKYQAKLDEARLNLDNTEITAPISGFISKAAFQEGSLIFANTSSVLATVSSLDPIYVNLTSSGDLYLQNLEDVAKGILVIPQTKNFEVTLILSDGTEYSQKGTVSFVSPEIKESTGTLSTRAIFANPQYALKPGLFVTARVSGATLVNALMVPQEAVQLSAGGYFVYLVTEGDTAEVRPVVVGDWYKEFWIIQSGIQKGDRVVVNGAEKLKNGAPLKIVKKT